MSIRTLLRGVACAVIAAASLTGGVATAAPAAPQAPLSISAENVITVTSANHAQVMELSKTKLVILDFGATWCGPCQQMKPVIERLAAEYGGRFVLGEVDVDTQRTLSTQYRIRYIPTLIPIRNATEYPSSRLVGFPGEAALKRWIDAQLAKG